MKFLPGESGNPSGRPKGSTNKRTQLTQLLEPRAEEIINKMVALALDGDPNALRLCVERLLPKAQHKPVEVDLPEFDEKSSISQNETIELILRGILSGSIVPDEGKKIISLIEEHQSRMQVRSIIQF